MHETLEWEKAARVEDLPEALHDIVAAIGMEATLRLIRIEGGSTFYLPKVDSVARRIRDRLIREEFDGYNRKQLARKYNLSEVHIRTIIKEA